VVVSIHLVRYDYEFPCGLESWLRWPAGARIPRLCLVGCWSLGRALSRFSRRASSPA